MSILSEKKSGSNSRLRRSAELHTDRFLRLVTSFLTRLLYDIEVTGLENLPDGPAILICNHISYVDGAILIAAQPRRIHFILTREVYEGWTLMKPIFKALGCIPIEITDPPKKVVASLRKARGRLDEGALVGIFAEGALTRTGMLREFRKGFTRIVRNSSHPIVPVYLGGAWGTITSHYHGRFVKKWHGLSRRKVSVIFGKPLPSDLEPADVRLAVMELSCDYFASRNTGPGGLGLEFLRTARANWNRTAVTDTAGNKLTYGGCVKGALAIAAPLNELARDRENIGVLLPLSTGAALANLAVVMAGHAPVNLNYTLPAKALASAAEQCKVSVVITSRAFLRESGIKLPVNSALYLEDLAPAGGVFAALKARFAPGTSLLPARDVQPGDTAAIIFSSGATGTHKAVMLNHRNILSGVESLRIVLDLSEGDGICSALPLFHSMGVAASLWYPLLGGLPVFYHSNPLGTERMARLARESGAAVLITTPALLKFYIRKARKEDMAGLRYIIAGGGKLPPGLADSFENKFGVRPLEAYGSAEASPVAALSVPHSGKGDNLQSGWQESSAGMPLPGVAMKVIDTVTGGHLPPGKEGQLLIKGPNVMKGYLDRPDLTAAAMRDGWYLTGDTASVDEEGFVSITGRLKNAPPRPGA